ncbi:hypothetical protein PF001_g25158 [Phytophthora fragariae]|uniref:Necrosis inducing protein NPP1 type n=3 Tax=Phytophthora fragariae TaxID=53985 RepID=A0A6A3U0U2_9STRA|nr:hypothetical protein PF006_g10031 [Phytophthora fragariae]KAE9278452.1 hypothetical protein PF001_g25158 [Phytophthora fragariae]
MVASVANSKRDERHNTEWSQHFTCYTLGSALGWDEALCASRQIPHFSTPTRRPTQSKFPMKLHAFLISVAVAFIRTNAVSISYETVAPIAQPEAVTISEKAGVKFKPQVKMDGGCTSFPAVNAAGETSSGLPADGGNYGCVEAPLGSQVYGRATWYKGVWAIMYAWYYPKSFIAIVGTGTHDWQNAVVWIDNPAVGTPKILGLSTSKKSETNYMKPSITTETFKSSSNYDKAKAPIQNVNVTSVKLVSTSILGPMFLRSTPEAGEFQDLIMWSQLPEAARTAFAGKEIGDVPFSDANFQKKLGEAWPF